MSLAAFLRAKFIFYIRLFSCITYFIDLGFKVSVKMHVLLLKEPRDGESGPDPYIKVDSLYLNPTVLTLLCSYVYSHCIVIFLQYFFFPQELASHGHKATLIPVLSFKFVSLNTLSDKVNPSLHS